MDYIINPMWFYWLGVFGSIKTVLFVLSIASFVCFIIGCIGMISAYVESGSQVGNPNDCDWIDFLNWTKFMKYVAPITVIIVLVTIFIPSKETILTVMIAKYATKENLSFTIDTVKQAVDYIIDAYAKLK